MARTARTRVRRDPLVERFASRLRDIRDRAGLSQTTLARLAHMSPAYVGRLERGEVAPGIDMVGRIAAALSVDPADFLTGGPASDRDEQLRERIRGQIDALLAHGDPPTLDALALLLRAMVEATVRRRARRGSTPPKS